MTEPSSTFRLPLEAEFAAAMRTVVDRRTDAEHRLSSAETILNLARRNINTQLFAVSQGSPSSLPEREPYTSHFTIAASSWRPGGDYRPAMNIAAQILAAEIRESLEPSSVLCSSVRRAFETTVSQDPETGAEHRPLFRAAILAELDKVSKPSRYHPAIQPR